jgi:hypothetical protein
MKKLLAIYLMAMSTFAHSAYYIEWGGQVSLEEIECISSAVNEENIICEQYNEVVVCSSPFVGELKSGDSRNFQVVSETLVVAGTRTKKTKRNAKLAEVESRANLKEMAKKLESFESCL